MTTESKNLFLRWLVFIKERFPLSRYALLILFFFLANSQVALKFEKLNVTEAGINSLTALLIVFFIFLHLRVLDEIKDYKEDIVNNKNRPLARGLICFKEAKIAAGLFILFELILSLFIGLAAFTSLIAVAIYSLIMYKEFFIKETMKAHYTLYALLHTLIACSMSLFIYSSVTGRYFWSAPRGYILFAFANWAVFNVFEFSRKITGEKQEPDEKETLDMVPRVPSAGGTVIFWSFIAVIIAFLIGLKIKLSLIYFVLLGLLLAGLTISWSLSEIRRSPFWCRIFLRATFLFILLYNVIIVFGTILKR
jgi:4-hydroxybenzoate polyprenyltransferase